MERRRRGNFSIFGGYSHFVPGVAELIILLLFFIIGILIGNSFVLVLNYLCGPEISKEYGMLVAYPLMFIPAMIYALVKSRRNEEFNKGYSVDNSNFGPLGGALCVILVIVLTFTANFTSDYLVTLLPEMPQSLKDLFKSLTNGSFILNFIYVSLFAPLFEEWLCRGTILRGLLYCNRGGDKQGFPPAVAIVVSAAIFALIHLNPWQAIPAFALGCVFGYVYWKTGSLKLTMLMHFFNNTLALVVGHIDSLKDMESWQDVFPANYYWVIYACCAILLVLSIMAFKRIPSLNQSGSCEEQSAMFE